MVITTKNRQEDLLKAVESAMAQRGLLEVIVIDDGSTDGSAEELKKIFNHREHGEHGGLVCSEAEPCLERPSGAAFSNPSPSELTQDSKNTSLIRSTDGPASLPATSYLPQVKAPEVHLLDPKRSTLDPQTASKPQLRLIRHEVSAGYIVRRNEGARVAKGDVIFSLDDDAVFSSPFVVEQTLRDFSHPRIGAVAIPFIEPHKANRELQRAPTREDVWITGSYIGTAHAVRRDVFLALRGYREHLVHQGEEGDFCLRMLAAEHPRTDSGWQKTERDLFNHGGQNEHGGLVCSEAGLSSGSRAGDAFSNPSTSMVARDSENTSLIRSADDPASLPVTSYSLPATAPEAPTPVTSPPLATPLEAAVPGFFVRLGNSDPIIHNESPKRDYSRMDFYGRRNDVLFHWQNTPMPDLLWQLPMTIAGGLVCAAKVGRWRKMLEGIVAGFAMIADGVKREPVLKKVVGLQKDLKRKPLKIH